MVSGKKLDHPMSELETMRETIMGEVRSMMSQFLEQMKQVKNEAKTPAENENRIDDTTATPARRILRYDEEIPELTSPLTAVKKSAMKPPTAGMSENNMAAQLILPLATGSSTMSNSDVNFALQKGMSKPPIFTGTNTDDLRTWWRQIKNFVSAFPSEVRGRVIKSYLRGAINCHLVRKPGKRYGSRVNSRRIGKWFSARIWVRDNISSCFIKD